MKFVQCTFAQHGVISLLITTLDNGPLYTNFQTHQTKHKLHGQTVSIQVNAVPEISNISKTERQRRDIVSLNRLFLKS